MFKTLFSKIKKIQDIIYDHMEIVNKVLTGEGQPDPDLAKKVGLDKFEGDLISDSFNYGSARIETGEELSDRKSIPDTTLTKTQEESLGIQKLRGSQAISSMRERIMSKVNMGIVNTENFIGDVKDFLTKPKESLIEELRNLPDKLMTEWNRTANTEMWNAKLRGEASAIASKKGDNTTEGNNTLVFKVPRPEACKQCKEMYLEADGITPKVFILGDLISNGDNYGLKSSEWKPVLGTVHPNCMCVLHIKPNGYEFNEKGKLVRK